MVAVIVESNKKFMEKEIKNGRVDWRTFLLVVTIGGTILSIFWNELGKTNNKLDKVREDVADVKTDTKITRSMLDALISRINGGSITIKNNMGD